MSTAFDPETGLRITEPIVEESGRSARAPRNPYELALAAVWILSAALAFTVLVAGSWVEAALVAGFAALAGVAHLTVRAITWRPADG